MFLAKYVGSESQGGWGAEEGTGSTPQSPAAVMLWGSQDYAEYDPSLMGGYTEKVLSQSVCSDVQGLFSNNGRYGYCANYWGLDTQPNNVYDAVAHCRTSYYSNSVFFYKGHSYSWTANANNPHCGVSGCPFNHFAVYDSEGLSVTQSRVQFIEDYRVHDQVSPSTFKFVCLWTCGSAWENATGDFNGGHSYGYMASWMGTTNLNANAYIETSDNSGRCYIGFANFSIWFTMSTTHDNYDYGDFVNRFFYYALQPGYTVKNALDQASYDTHGGNYFYNCPLYQNIGYDLWDPRPPAHNVRCWMVVRGDGDCTLPK